MNAQDTKMAEHLQMTRNQRPNYFNKLLGIYANTTGRTEEQIVAVYNEWLDKEFEGLEEDGFNEGED